MTAAHRRTAVRMARENAGISERRACRLTGVGRSSCRYRSVRPQQSELRERLRSLAHQRPRWDYKRLHVLLLREGVQVNHKRVYRLYREEGLAMRRRKRKRVAVPRQVRERPVQPNERWSMDFISDALAQGRRFRCLTLVDDFTRECPLIKVDTSLPALRVIRELDHLALTRGLPRQIVVDNGPEFAGKLLDAWAHERGIQLLFIRPGKPIENAYIESCNGRFRDECLNEHWFTSLADARRVIEGWRQDYNQVRPHSALGNRTPSAFAQEISTSC